MIRIGIMSFAHLHAEAYIDNIRSQSAVKWIGFVDDDPARVEKYANQYQTYATTDFDNFFAERPDGVIICSENNARLQMVEMAIEAGVRNILCEKPLATNLEDAERIVTLAARRQVNFMTAFPMRFSIPIIEVKNQLDSGTLGKTYCFRAENEGRMPGIYRSWFVDPEKAGGGALQDHMVHLTDLFRWITRSEVASVYAQSNGIFHRDEVAVETAGMALLRFSNGMFATIDCSWSRPDHYPTWGGLNFEVVTERGAVQIDAFRQNLSIFRNDSCSHSLEFWGSDLNQRMINEFIRSIQEKRPATITALDGLRTVEVIQAAYESAATGRTVKI